MKHTVVVDESGQIIATVRHPDVDADGAPSLAVIPLHGQRVHTLELPEELNSPEGIRRLHEVYTVRGDGDTAQIHRRA